MIPRIFFEELKPLIEIGECVAVVVHRGNGRNFLEWLQKTISFNTHVAINTDPLHAWDSDWNIEHFVAIGVNFKGDMGLVTCGIDESLSHVLSGLHSSTMDIRGYMLWDNVIDSTCVTVNDVVDKIHCSCGGASKHVKYTTFEYDICTVCGKEKR